MNVAKLIANMENALVFLKTQDPMANVNTTVYAVDITDNPGDGVESTSFVINCSASTIDDDVDVHIIYDSI